MRKWLRYTVGFGTVLLAVMITAVIFLIEDEEVDCACTIDPSTHPTDEDIANYIAVPVPAEAEYTSRSAYYLDPGNRAGGTEAYISFKLPANAAEAFIAALPEVQPFQPQVDPFKGKTEHISNFGWAQSSPEIYESSQYDAGDSCSRAIMVDKSDAALYHIFIYARCEG